MIIILLYFRQNCFQEQKKKLRQFKEAVDRYLKSLDTQVSYSKSEPYQTRLKNARMYVSHFLTVFNMCVKRGEIKASDRSFYSIPENSGELPDMSSDIAVRIPLREKGRERPRGESLSIILQSPR